MPNLLAKTPGSVIPHQAPRRQGGRADNSASPTPAAVRRPRGDRTMASEPPVQLAWAQPRLVPCGTGSEPEAPPSTGVRPRAALFTSSARSDPWVRARRKPARPEQNLITL